MAWIDRTDQEAKFRVREATPAGVRLLAEFCTYAEARRFLDGLDAPDDLAAAQARADTAKPAPEPKTPART